MNLSDIKILYEDNHLIAVQKQGGWLVQGDETGDLPLVEMVREYIRIRYKKPGNVFCGVIHRLDRPVSGVVIFARTSKGLEKMNQVFKDRKITKTYWAICIARPEIEYGHLEHYLVKDEERNVTKAYAELSNRANKQGVKKAELDYELLASLGDHHLLKVNPITGRPHQIRVQLKELGCTIKGDVKYGYPNKWSKSHIYLHCRSLSFLHPVSNEHVEITCNLPNDQIWGIFKHLQE